MFKSFGFLELFGFEHTLWRFYSRNASHTKFDIYGFFL